MRKSKRAWLPALGAFIVLATFVTRDGLREHYREVAARVDSASIAYAQEAAVANVSAGVEGLRRILEKQRTPWLEDYSTMYQVWIAYSQKITRLRVLLEVLQGTSADREAITEIQRDDESFHNSIQDFGQLASSGSTSVARLNAASHDLSVKSGAIFGQMNRLEIALLDAARREKRNSAQWSVVFGYASYLLYAIGWTLGFVQKLQGSPGADENAELG